MEKTAVKLVRDKRKAVNSNHDTPVSGMLVYGDNNHKYNLGFVPTIWDDNNEVLIVAHQNSDPLTDTYREPFQLTVVPYEMIQYLHINMDLQNARALMKEFGFEEKIINLFLNEQAPTTDMYAFGAVRKGELDEIYKLKEEQERQAEAALMRLRNEQRSRGIPTYDLANNPKDVPMAGPQTAPSAPVEDTTSDNVPVVQYRLDDPLYDPTAVRRVTRSIDDSYPYPTPNVPDLTYLGVHADETNTGTILPVAPAPTPAPVTPPVSPTPGHGTSGTATPVAPTPTTPSSSGTGSTATPVTPGSTSGSGTTTVTPAPATPGSTTPTTGTGSSTTSPANPSGTSGTGSTGTTPVTPAPTPATPAGSSTTSPATPVSPTPAAPTTEATTPTPAAPAPSVPVTPAPTPVNGLSANGAIDLFSKLNKIISDKLAGQTIASSEFDTITPEYTTTAGDQISKHDFNTSLGALSTTLVNIHGGTAPAITVAEDANPVESTVVDNLIATVKAMVL